MIHSVLKKKNQGSEREREGEIQTNRQIDDREKKKCPAQRQAVERTRGKAGGKFGDIGGEI